MSTKREVVVRTLLDQSGRTYAADANIRLKDAPMPLYQLMVLSHLLSARIKADIAVAAARALFAAGMRTAGGMAQASWQERVDALGEGGYRRYDERTATMLGQGADLLLQRYQGDLRRLHESGGDLKKLLQEFPGLGPTGANIFLREVQGVWTDVGPYFDRKTLDGAERTALPTSPEALAKLVDDEELPLLAAALTRVALDRRLAERVRSIAAG
jgi:endonuclease III